MEGFCFALQQPHNLTSISLIGNALKLNHLIELGESLRSIKILKKFDISNNEIDTSETGTSTEFVVPFLDFFETNTNLTYLNFSRNRLHSTTAYHIGEKLHNVPNLEYFDISGNCITGKFMLQLGSFLLKLEKLKKIIIGNQKYFNFYRELKMRTIFIDLSGFKYLEFFDFRSIYLSDSMSRLLGKSLLGNSTLTKISSRAEILEFHNPPILEFLCNSNSLIHLKLSTSKYGLRISNEFMENVSQILLKNPVLKSLKIYVNSNPNSLKILYNGLSKNCTLESFGKALEKKNGEEKDFESIKYSGLDLVPFMESISKITSLKSLKINGCFNDSAAPIVEYLENNGTNLTSLNLHKNNITDQDKINILKLILFQKVKLKKINFKYRDYPPIVPDYSDTLYEIFRENLLEKCIVEWDICELEQSLVLEKNTSLKALSEPYLCGETLMEILSNINTTITEVKPKFATTNFQLSELVWANKEIQKAVVDWPKNHLLLDLKYKFLSEEILLCISEFDFPFELTRIIMERTLTIAIKHENIPTKWVDPPKTTENF